MAQITILKNKDTDEQYFPQTKFEAIIDASEHVPTNEQLEATDANVAQLVKTIADLNANNTTWSAWNSTNVNLLNSVTINSNSDDYPMIRSRKINGQLEYQLSFNVKNITAQNTAVIQLPTMALPEKNNLFSFISTAGSDLGIWQIDDTGKVILVNNLKNVYDSSTNYKAVVNWNGAE